MNKEDKKKLYEVESKIVLAWSELVVILGRLDSEGEEVEALKKGKIKIREGLEIIVNSLMED